MSDPERQPLLGSPSAEQRAFPRIKNPTFTRFVSIAAPIAFLYATYSLLAASGGGHGPSTWFDSYKLPHKNWPHAEIQFSELEDIAISYPKAARAKEWSRYYTSGPHLGGANYSQALWTKDRLEELGLDTTIESYDIYVNYPLGHRLALLKDTGSHGEYKVEFEAGLEEPVLKEDTTSGLVDRIPTFHGYSASGNVTGPLVFANYGTFTDYDTLLAHNITIKGSIIIVKYGGVFRGLKVKRAQELGALGVIIYSDPGDDFGITPENGYEEYPVGPARNSGSVQRGSVQFLSYGPGDPTTPGYPSHPGAPRKDPSNTTPTIPSLPISYNDAIPLLLALNSHGPRGSSFGWSDGGLTGKGIHYNIGPTPPGLVVNLVNEQDYKITPMWDVIARIPGTLGSTEGVVVSGNHRDAWIAGGAGDPNSGSAALLEVAGALAAMRKRGWQPTRDIILASWDGEEYGLLGSTEWVEDHAKYLTEHAVAYINLDIGAVGSHFRVSANPLLNSLLREAAGKTPITGKDGKTVSDFWNGHIATLGSGSDYTAFQDFLGIPSSDMAFVNDIGDSVWMYHSNFDSFSWMERFGDKGFVHHEAAAKMWALMLLHLSTQDVLPLNITEYAANLEGYLAGIQKKKGGNGDSPHPLTLSEFSANGVGNFDGDLHLDGYGNPTEFSYEPPKMVVRDQSVVKHHNNKPDFDLGSLPAHMSTLTAHAVEVQAYIATLLRRREELASKGPAHGCFAALASYIRRVQLWREISVANNALRKFDRMFIDEEGLGGGRGWFKHVVFAPGRWTGYAGVVLPGLGESWEDGDAEGWVLWRHRVGRCVGKAVNLLRAI
ncbi:glutamate carboxypeptidase [Peziza echinospora]|nr:glutamate carboxypeptidase [Peziza echinospora]